MVTKYFSIRQLKDLFKIDPLIVVDEMKWHPYALSEGLADLNTKVPLSLIQLSRMSQLSSQELEDLWNELRN